MNQDRLKDLMDKNEIGAVVSVSRESLCYTTGHFNNSLYVLGMQRPAFSILPKQGQPVYLVSRAEIVSAREQSWIEDIRPWTSAAPIIKPVIKILVDILSEKRLLDEKIAIELEALPVAFYQELVSLAPRVAFVDATDILSTLRIIKEEREIELLEFAARAQRKATDAAFAIAKPGDTARHIANLIISNMLSLGMEDIAFFTLSASSRGHGLPTEDKIQVGDIVKADCGGFFKGYYSDLARTYAVGESSEEQRQIYRALVRAEKAAGGNLKVGTKASDVYNIAKKTFEENYPALFTQAYVGHGMGAFLHEAPWITPDNEIRLQENMIVNLEPIFSLSDSTFHVEDLFRVTSSGPKVLTGTVFDEELPLIK